MSRQSLASRRSQSGFTLVELAVVMIIIGLLIGGVLKGQELITNAQVTSTIAQIKGIDAATSTFRDMYNGLPGDLRNPRNRLTDCAAGSICDANGDGNGRLDAAPGAAPGTETTAYFVHLAKADVLTGVNTGATTADCTGWGGCYPGANVNGGFMMGYTGGGATMTGQVGGRADAVRNGHYLTLSGDPHVAMTASEEALTPNQAFRIDAKIDDGNPATGSVLSGGGDGCVDGGNYDELNGAAVCNLFIRIQG